MKVTSIGLQKNNESRVNIFVDKKYRFSLDISQVSDLNIKVDQEYSESDILRFESESDFGKTYIKALNYCLIRPRSVKEIKDYLFKKVQSADSVSRVIERLESKGYLNDNKFAKYWIENRLVSRGVSRRRLNSELRLKGIKQSIIDDCLAESDRNDSSEIQKIINKKRSKYRDNKKLAMYLSRLGFEYDDIKNNLASGI